MWECQIYLFVWEQDFQDEVGWRGTGPRATVRDGMFGEP